jgi:hypothetical protein
LIRISALSFYRIKFVVKMSSVFRRKRFIVESDDEDGEIANNNFPEMSTDGQTPSNFTRAAGTPSAACNLSKVTEEIDANKDGAVDSHETALNKSKRARSSQVGDARLHSNEDSDGEWDPEVARRAMQGNSCTPFNTSSVKADTAGLSTSLIPFAALFLNNFEHYYSFHRRP